MTSHVPSVTLNNGVETLRRVSGARSRRMRAQNASRFFARRDPAMVKWLGERKP